MPKTLELTELQSKFLEVLFSPECKGDLTLARKLAGYSENTPVSSIIAPIKDHVIEKAKDVLAANSVKASYSLVDALDNPNSLGIQNKLKAAQEILNRAGVSSKEEESNLKVPEGGVVILPAKNSKVTIQVEEVNEVHES